MINIPYYSMINIKYLLDVYCIIMAQEKLLLSIQYDQYSEQYNLNVLWVEPMSRYGDPQLPATDNYLD